MSDKVIDWLFYTFIGIMGTMLLILVGLLIYAIFWGGHTIDKGVVIEKNHIPSHVMSSVIMSGKTCIPITTIQPEQWQLVIKDGETVETFTVPHNTYKTTNIGDSIKFETNE